MYIYGSSSSSSKTIIRLPSRLERPTGDLNVCVVVVANVVVSMVAPLFSAPTFRAVLATFGGRDCMKIVRAGRLPSTILAGERNELLQGVMGAGLREPSPVL